MSTTNLHYLQFGTFQIPYLIEKSARSQRVRILADQKKGIVVVLPESAHERDAHKFVELQSDWVFRHWRRHERLKQMHGDHLLPLGERPEVWYLGKTYRIQVEQYKGRPSVHFDGEKVVIQCFDNKDADRLLNRWYTQQARAVIATSLLQYTEKMKVKYQDFVLKDQKTRWGSCSSLGNLYFNWRLIKAPKEVLDYVVVHELAHIKEMNHSDRFWRIVVEYSKDYKKHTKWLKDNAFLLHV